jgi:hypothetical protein
MAVYFVKLTKNGTLVADSEFTASKKRSESNVNIHGFKNVWTGRGSGNGKLGLIAGKPNKPLAQGVKLKGFVFTDDVCVSDPKKGTIYWVDPILSAEPKKAKKKA